jgi:hypothetical protein
MLNGGEPRARVADAPPSSSFIDPNTEWTGEVELMLRGWLEKSAGYCWVHLHSANYYERTYNRLMLPLLMVVNALASISSAIAVGGDGASSRVQWLTAIMTAASLLLVKIQDSLKLTEKMARHRQLAALYSHAYRSLQVTLTLPREHRGPAQRIIQSTFEEMDRLASTELGVPPRILTRYKAKFAHCKIALIDEANGIQSISAALPPPESRSRSLWSRLRQSRRAPPPTKQGTLPHVVQTIPSTRTTAVLQGTAATFGPALRPASNASSELVLAVQNATGSLQSLESAVDGAALPQSNA